MKHKKISIIKPCCFVSYAWESDEHRSWVAKFVSRLQKKGVFTHFDEWDVRPGQDLQEYMEYAIRSSDFVLLICTPIYAEKADKGLGGVGYEKSIVTGEIFMDKNKSFKFVPVLRSGEPQTAVPSFLKSKAYINFRDDERYEDAFEQLLRHLYDTPKTTRPPLGSAPQFVKRGRKGAKRQQTPSTDILTFDIEGNNYHFKLPDWWDTVEVEMPKDVRTDGDLARYVEEKYGQDVGTATTWRQALKCWALYDAKHGYLPVYIAHCFAVGGQHQKAVNTYTDLWDVASLLSKNKTWYSTYLAFEAGRQYLQICQIALAKAWLKKAAARKRVGDDAVKYYASEAHRILKEI